MFSGAVLPGETSGNLRIDTNLSPNRIYRKGFCRKDGGMIQLNSIRRVPKSWGKSGNALDRRSLHRLPKLWGKTEQDDSEGNCQS